MVKVKKVKSKIPPLMKHQKFSVLFLRDQNRVFDTSDPGTGKTAVHIRDFADRRRNGEGCALIFCPKSIMKCAWGDDFKTFEPTMKVAFAYSDNREEAFDEDADAYVTNIDAVRWVSQQKDKFFDRFTCLIIDESTSVKHQTSKRSAAMRKIKKHFEVRRLLTGTPTSNGICDIHHQMLLVDDGVKLGESFFAFRSATCAPVQKGPGRNMIEWVDKPNIEATVAALIQDHVIRHRFEDCVDIPPNHRYAVEFELGAHHRKIYDRLERDSLLTLNKSNVTALNGAVLYGKLLQCASGAIYTDDKEYESLDTDRNELIIDLVDARKHSIVFFNWKHQRDQLIQEIERNKWSYAVIDGDANKKGEREDIVRAYQAGRYKVLLAQAQSAAHGLTLTKGTTTIFASPTPNLEHFLQAYKRIYRIGQTEKTETIMVIAKKTIDTVVWASCQRKDVKQSSLLDYLKE